jgi:MFS transporter, OFA family, oxalate/formate antiporter
VAGAFVALFAAYGTQYAFGVFFGALLTEFGWSRASLSGIFALYAFSYSLWGFLAGRLSDRWGPRAVLAVGGLFLGAAIAGMARVTHLWEPYVLYGVFAAVGMGTTYIPCNTTVVKWFLRRRGLAVGLASSGGSLGALLLPPVAQLLVSAVGWRAAYVVFGVAILVVLELVALVMRRDPESMGLHPDGADAGRAAAQPAEAEWPLRHAMRTQAFWVLSATFTATWLPVFIPLVHVVPFTRDLGFAPLTAATALSALGGGAVAGRLLMGAVSDRIGRRATGVIGTLLQAAAFLAFSVVHSLSAVYAAAVVFGFAYGSVSMLFPALVSDFFGRRQAGAIAGFLFAFAGSAGAIGPLAAGAIYDARGSYAVAFYLSAACNVVAAALIVLARPPRRAPSGRAGQGAPSPGSPPVTRRRPDPVAARTARGASAAARRGDGAAA